MKKQNKNLGSFRFLLYLFLFLVICYVISSFTSNFLSAVVIIALIVFSFKFITVYSEQIKSGKPTIVGRLLYILNMDNWNCIHNNNYRSLYGKNDNETKYMSQEKYNTEITERLSGLNKEAGDIFNRNYEQTTNQQLNCTINPNRLHITNWLDEPFLSNYREVKFTGKNFNNPVVQLCAAILLSNRNGSEIKQDNKYAIYFEEIYGLTNISYLHSWLLNNGYFRKPNLNEALGLYKVPELKIILDSLGLKKSGKKIELINRLEASLTEAEKTRVLLQCTCVFPSEKGIHFLDENHDLVMFHKKSYGLYYWEFEKHRICHGKKRLFYDTIFQALSERNYIYQVKECYSRLEMNYWNLSNCLYDAQRYDLALQNALYRLYFSTNKASQGYLFDIELVDYNSLTKTVKRITANDSFNSYTIDRIIELKQYFTPLFIDVIYDCPILPYCIFDKQLFTEAIECMYNEDYFDAEYFNLLIQENYIKYIGQFIKEA